MKKRQGRDDEPLEAPSHIPAVVAALPHFPDLVMFVLQLAHLYIMTACILLMSHALV